MRLAGQAKLGFYPAHAKAIGGILVHLAMPTVKAGEVNIIDPCAGEGVAIKQIAEGLGVPYDRVYAVELDAERARLCRESMPGSNVIGPASFLGTQITSASFGLAYVNPPFDDELGGGRREEHTFIERSARLLVPGGVLVAVLPLTALAGNRDLCQYLDSRFEDIAVYQFPEGHDPEGNAYQPFREVVVFGKLRRTPLPKESVYTSGHLHRMEMQWRNQHWEHRLPRLGKHQPKGWYAGGGIGGPEDHARVYSLIHAWRPNTFRKISYTDEELAEVLEGSKLNSLLETFEAPPPARPPLPLDKGHVALLLASGMLDGVIEGPDGPHVVRGTARKYEYISKRESTENEGTGAVTEKVIFSQKITLTIRAVTTSGEIKTFTDEPANDAEGDEGMFDDPEEEAA